MELINALVVKLVDTKDLKAEGFTCESVHGSPRQSKISCNYLNGLIYLLGDIKVILFYLISKTKIIKTKNFRNKI